MTFAKPPIVEDFLRKKYEDLGCSTVYQIYKEKLVVFAADDIDNKEIGWVMYSHLAILGV